MRPSLAKHRQRFTFLLLVREQILVRGHIIAKHRQRFTLRLHLLSHGLPLHLKRSALLLHHCIPAQVCSKVVMCVVKCLSEGTLYMRLFMILPHTPLP